MLFSLKVHRSVYILALAIIVCSLPFSVFTTSVGVITLAVNFLLDGNWHYKINAFRRNKLLWIFLLIYLPVFFSFFYSSSTSVAIKELRLWLPFIVIPTVVALSNSLSGKEYRFVLVLFVLAVIVATIIGTIHYFAMSSAPAVDVRQISKFVSHIRFALMVNLAIAVLLHFVFNDTFFKWPHRVIMLIVAAWLVAFLFILQSLTGIAMFFVLLGLGFIWTYIKIKNSVARFALVSIGLSILFVLISFITHRIDQYYTRTTVDYNNLPEFTVNGNAYTHDTAKLVYENGNLLYINICYSELKNEWERRSSLDIDGSDLKGQRLSQTLIRYLASLGLTKDSVGVWKLSQSDINSIEKGVASVVYKNGFGINARIYQTLWEIDSYLTEGTIGNSSVVQRVVFAKAALFVIRNNFWFGVGSGDVLTSMNDYYLQEGVNLTDGFRFMPHNQYLTVWAGAGLFGFAIFLMALVLPFILSKKFKQFLPVYFLLMIMVSMLNEDTFKTHIGVSFAAIFYSLFIFEFSFANNINDPESPKD